MEALQLQQCLVDAGMPSAGTGAAKAFLRGLCQRLNIQSGAAGLKQQFFGLLTHLLGKAPALACSWLSDYLASSTTLVSSDPEEAYILQPQSVLAWCQQATAGLQQRVSAFLQSGPSARVDAVLEFQQTAQSLLLVATAVQAVSSSGSAEVQDLINSLRQLQQATKVLQVLDQLQQQQMPSPGRPTPGANWSNIPNGTPASSSGGFGQQPVFRPRNAACGEWKQQIEQRRGACADGKLFLDDLLAHLQLQARLPGSSPALAYPYQDVLTCIDVLFVSGGSSSSSAQAWHAKLSLLLYYLLDGGWLISAEPFAQGFQLPLTMVQQWQCHHLLDAAASSSNASSGSSSGKVAAGAGSLAALDQACHLLGAIACPSTPFRFVEALLQAGRPATALAVQRARCAGSSAGSSSSSSSSSLNEAEVLLRVQLGCGLLAEAFCDLRRHCDEIPMPARSQHINTLMRRLTNWALSPNPTPSTAAAAAATASRMQQQLQIQDRTAAAAAAGAADAVTGGDAGRVRQQQLLLLPLNASEESVLVAVLRERMAAGKPGGHLLPLYLLQRGRTLEALNAYADYKASPAAAGTSSSHSGDAAADAEAATNRALLHKRLDAVMSAAAESLPPALRAATAAADGGSTGTRSVLQGLGASEARRLQGNAGNTIVLQQRGIERPAFLAPLLYAAEAAGSVRGVVGTPGRYASVGKAAGASVRSVQSTGAGRASTGRQFAAGATSTAGKDSNVCDEEVMAEAGPGTVRLGGKNTGTNGAEEVVPLLFGTPAPSAAAAGASALASRTPGIVRGGMFDTPAGLPPGGGASLWAKTPAVEGFVGMTEADFERQVRFATPQPKTATAAAGNGGVFTHTGKRSHKRMRKTPI